MTHKENQDRVRKEAKQIAEIEHQCQAAIRDILLDKGLEARIVFYPVTK